MISTLLAGEGGCGMLARLFVSTVRIGVRELRIAGFLDVSVVANGKVCACSEGWAEVH
jgi:hypothetical protein